MKKILVILLIIAIFIVGTLSFVYNNKIETKIPSSIKKCEIVGKKIQYIKEGFIYFKNPAPDSGEYIYSDFAIYKRNLETSGWEVKPQSNINNSLYNSSMIWINQGKFLDGTPINCIDLETDDQLPAGFRQFILSHQIFFNKYKKEAKILE